MRRTSSLTLHQLEIFATVAHEGSFTRAAELLLRSEAAISQQIKLLEAAVGARLLERAHQRPIRLTEAGRRMLSTCEDVFARLESTLGELDALGRAERGDVTMSSGGYFGSYLLPPIYAAFQQDVPGISVHLQIVTSANCMEAVRRGEADLAVLGGEI